MVSADNDTQKIRLIIMRMPDTNIPVTDAIHYLLHHAWGEFSHVINFNERRPHRLHAVEGFRSRRRWVDVEKGIRSETLHSTRILVKLIIVFSGPPVPVTVRVRYDW